MSVNIPFYSMFVYSSLMSIFLFFIVIVELVQYKHSQPCCIGKYKTDLESVREREREREDREGEMETMMLYIHTHVHRQGQISALIYDGINLVYPC